MGNKYDPGSQVSHNSQFTIYYKQKIKNTIYIRHSFHEPPIGIRYGNRHYTFHNEDNCLGGYQMCHRFCRPVRCFVNLSSDSKMKKHLSQE